MDLKEPQYNTGLLQPAKFDYKTMEKYSYGDPSILSQLETGLEDADDKKTQMDASQWANKALERRGSVRKRLFIAAIVLLVALQTFFGLAANSLACLIDSIRLLSDSIGQHQINRKGPKTMLRLECLVLFVIAITLLSFNVALLTISFHRLLDTVIYTIDPSFIILCAITSLATNIFLVIVHFKSACRERQFVTVTDFIGIKFQQSFHMVFNHGLGLLIIVEAVLISIQPRWTLVDTIASTIFTVLNISNIACIMNHCYRNLITNDQQKANYQQIGGLE